MVEQYRPSRRAWLKLWTEEWLTGTVRWQLTAEERSIWLDLMCLAGRSRFPGIIASGYESDHKSPLLGYPLSWLAAQCRVEEQLMAQSIAKLETQQRIKTHQYGGFILVSICSWEKYQSEYMIKRQRRRYNEASRSDGDYKRRRKSHKSPPKTPTEEVEVDVEVDVDKKKKQLPLASLATPPVGGFVLPEWVPVGVWKDFKAMRKKIRSELTEAAEKLTIQELINLREVGNDPVAVLEQSIQRGWRGVFPIGKGPTHGKDNAGKSWEDRLDAENAAAVKRVLSKLSS